jgi:hypothetical protein
VAEKAEEAKRAPVVMVVVVMVMELPVRRPAKARAE